jgi:transcriptional regulator with XRE-family HTH domain
MPQSAAKPPRRTELVDRRRRLGFTQQTLGEAVGVSVATIAGWERGGYAPLPRHRPRLAKALKVSVIEVDRMIDPHATPMVLNGHRVPTWLNHYESLVEAADWLGEVESVAIPALLQTRAYAELVERASEHMLADEQINEAVELRQTRQAALHREVDPLQLTVVLPEHLLRAVVGSPSVMREQLEHLAEVHELPNVETRLLPADARSTCFVNGFELLKKRGAVDPFIVVTLDVCGARYHEDPDQVIKFVRRFDHLLDSALTVDESARRIQEIRRA